METIFNDPLNISRHIEPLKKMLNLFNQLALTISMPITNPLTEFWDFNSVNYQQAELIISKISLLFVLSYWSVVTPVIFSHRNGFTVCEDRRKRLHSLRDGRLC